MGTPATQPPDAMDALSKEGIRLTAPVPSEGAKVLTPDALRFVARLSRAFAPLRDSALRVRRERQEKFDAGELPHFLPETKAVRDEDWKVAPPPEPLSDRRVEITGPPERKMVINALNSGAKVFMADFEDANSPTWRNCVLGQANLFDAVRRTITFTNPDGRHYRLNDATAVLMVRPRGWHLSEKHMLVDGVPVPAGLFDFGLFFFHNAKEQIERGAGPYFYLPKLESHHEAMLWNDVFVTAQKTLGVPNGTVKATALIETIPAAFEMDEILFELKDHSAGLNCGRWDYIFSFIKRFRNRPEFVLPDRALVTMTTHFMRSYSKLLIRTCHRRGAHAMGGMAAQIPIKNDEKANEEALAKVRADKAREAGDGHDGTWVAHPGLVPVALAEFDREMPEANQIGSGKQTDVEITQTDLLRAPEGKITEEGLRTNLGVGVDYLAHWLSGAGCVPLHHLMEDAATSEISRAQVWQWIRHGARLEDGRVVTEALAKALLKEEMDKIRRDAGEERFGKVRYAEAAELFKSMMTGDFEEFLTLPAYERLA